MENKQNSFVKSREIDVELNLLLAIQKSSLFVSWEDFNFWNATKELYLIEDNKLSLNFEYSAEDLLEGVGETFSGVITNPESLPLHEGRELIMYEYTVKTADEVKTMKVVLNKQNRVSR